MGVTAGNEGPLSRSAARIDRFAAAVGRLTGWRRALTSGLCGIAAAFAFPPYDAWPIMFVSFGLLVWLLDGCVIAHPKGRARLKAAGWIGFWFGFGFFLSGFYWISEAFLVNPWRDAWLIPFVLTGFPAWMALYFTGATILAVSLWGRGATRIFALAFAFGLAEFVRGHLFTGQPWDLVGYALTDTLSMMQLAALFGVYALSVLAVAIFAGPFAVFAAPGSSAHGRRSALICAVSLLVLLGLGTAWGAHRLATHKTRFTHITLRIVQPAVPQVDKWKPGNAEKIFSDYLSLSGETKNGVALKNVDLLIWPETAVPIPLANAPEALRIIGNELPRGTTLLSGSVRIEPQYGPKGQMIAPKFYNSLLAINSQGRIIDHYDKIHLVPFGEYLPFEHLMNRLGIMALTGTEGGFTAGTGPRRLTVPDVPRILPLICYEILFPDEVNESAVPRPAWMLNVTNDAWFGRSIGPYQHFHQARVRAVEQGLPLVRSANTGISGIVGPYGRIKARLDLGKRGIIDGKLPQPIPPTLFVRFERLIEICTALLALIGCLAERVY